MVDVSIEASNQYIKDSEATISRTLLEIKRLNMVERTSPRKRIFSRRIEVQKRSISRLESRIELARQGISEAQLCKEE